MRFRDQQVDRAGRFALGVDSATGRPYLSIPVSNARVDYEEVYRLTAGEAARFAEHRDEALAFAERCRSRACDERLILPPGAARGAPR